MLTVTIKPQKTESGSCNVRVHGKYTAIDKSIKMVNKNEKMGAPWGIAFGRDGLWPVTDCSYHCVWIFDRENQLVRNFGSKGTDDGEFNAPL